MDTQALRALDRNALWHPFTQMRGWQDEDAPIIERARGHDAVRHRRQRLHRRHLVAVVQRPRPRPPAHRRRGRGAARPRRAHDDARPLAPAARSSWPQRLLDRAARRRELTRVFYSDNGSTAVEIALKMAFQCWPAARRARSDRASSTCATSYHGDTIGSVSVGGIDLFHTALPAAAVRRLPRRAGRRRRPASACCAEHGDEICAVVVEPLVQGAAGHPRPARRLPARRARAVRRARRVPDLRRGRHRLRAHRARCSPASRRASSPDFLCVAKGLTGGYLPLAATLDDRARLRGLPRRVRGVQARSSTATPTPATRWPARRRSRRSTSSSRSARSSGCSRRSRCSRELLDEHVAPLAAVAEIRRCGFMVGIELSELPARGADGPPGHARGAPRAARSSARSATPSC